MEFGFEEKKPELPAQVPSVPEKEKKNSINFQELPKDSENILNNKQEDLYNKYGQEESIGIPYDETQQHSSYLTLVLSPNFRDLELMIRGLEYVKRFNRITNKEEIIIRRIKDHPLNETGVNRIMNELRIYCSPEIKLGRKNERDYYGSVNHVCHSIVRLVYKNLKAFGMEDQHRQRSAKSFCNAIIEFVHASFSRSLEGRENDLSRATEFRIESNIDGLNDPSKLFNRSKKDELKN